jgi:hypothetical protein
MSPKIEADNNGTLWEAMISTSFMIASHQQSIGGGDLYEFLKDVLFELNLKELKKEDLEKYIHPVRLISMHLVAFFFFFVVKSKHVDFFFLLY